jgi:hypothetical protein
MNFLALLTRQIEVKGCELLLQQQQRYTATTHAMSQQTYASVNAQVHMHVLQTMLKCRGNRFAALATVFWLDIELTSCSSLENHAL